MFLFVHNINWTHKNAVYTGAFGSSVASSKWFFACRNIETRSASFTVRGKEYCRSVIGRYVSVYRVKPFASVQSYCQYSLQISHRISFTFPLRFGTYVFRRLLPTQENITTYWFYYVFYPFSVLALISPFFVFSLPIFIIFFCNLWRIALFSSLRLRLLPHRLSMAWQVHCPSISTW